MKSMAMRIEILAEELANLADLLTPVLPCLG